MKDQPNEGGRDLLTFGRPVSDVQRAELLGLLDDLHDGSNMLTESELLAARLRPYWMGWVYVSAKVPALSLLSGEPLFAIGYRNGNPFLMCHPANARLLLDNLKDPPPP